MLKFIVPEGTKRREFTPADIDDLTMVLSRVISHATSSAEMEVNLHIRRAEDRMDFSGVRFARLDGIGFSSFKVASYSIHGGEDRKVRKRDNRMILASIEYTGPLSFVEEFYKQFRWHLAQDTKSKYNRMFTAYTAVHDLPL